MTPDTCFFRPSPRLSASAVKMAFFFARRGKTATTGLREMAARVKLIFPIALEWRNWQTQQTQNLPPVTRHGGSTPPSSILGPPEVP